MGSSGAGKTTLLNVLNRTGINNLEIESGEILVNGNTVAPNVMSKMAGFVQQEDLFFGTLRVREHLKFQANLRMKGASKEDMNKKVESIMQSVGLKQCEDSIIVEGYIGRRIETSFLRRRAADGSDGYVLRRTHFRSRLLQGANRRPSSQVDGCLREDDCGDDSSAVVRNLPHVR